LDSITKYSSDVVKYEMKAKEMAQKMEEASIKAENSRMNMMKVKILFLKNFYSINFKRNYQNNIFWNKKN